MIIFNVTICLMDIYCKYTMLYKWFPMIFMTTTINNCNMFIIKNHCYHGNYITHTNPKLLVFG